MDREDQSDFDFLKHPNMTFNHFSITDLQSFFFFPFLSIGINISSAILQIRKPRHCYYCLNYSYLADTYFEFWIL